MVAHRDRRKFRGQQGFSMIERQSFNSSAVGTALEPRSTSYRPPPRHHGMPPITPRGKSMGMLLPSAAAAYDLLSRDNAANGPTCRPNPLFERGCRDFPEARYSVPPQNQGIGHAEAGLSSDPWRCLVGCACRQLPGRSGHYYRGVRNGCKYQRPNLLGDCSGG